MYGLFHACRLAGGSTDDRPVDNDNESLFVSADDNRHGTTRGRPSPKFQAITGRPRLQPFTLHRSAVRQSNDNGCAGAVVHSHAAKAGRVGWSLRTRPFHRRGDNQLSRRRKSLVTSVPNGDSAYWRISRLRSSRICLGKYSAKHREGRRSNSGPISSRWTAELSEARPIIQASIRTLIVS